MQYKRTVTRIGSQYPRWFRVERENSVVTDGRMPWILASSAERVDEQVNEQQSKTASWRMRYKRTVTEIGPGRTANQRNGRWHNALNPSIALTAGRTGKWVEDEDSKLEDAVQK
jgi:hypothetical protein